MTLREHFIIVLPTLLACWKNIAAMLATGMSVNLQLDYAIRLD